MSKCIICKQEILISELVQKVCNKKQGVMIEVHFDCLRGKRSRAKEREKKAKEQALKMKQGKLGEFCEPYYDDF